MVDKAEANTWAGCGTGGQAGRGHIVLSGALPRSQAGCTTTALAALPFTPAPHLALGHGPDAHEPEVVAVHVGDGDLQRLAVACGKREGTSRGGAGSDEQVGRSRGVLEPGCSKPVCSRTSRTSHTCRSFNKPTLLPATRAAHRSGFGAR